MQNQSKSRSAKVPIQIIVAIAEHESTVLAVFLIICIVCTIFYSAASTSEFTKFLKGSGEIRVVNMHLQKDKSSL